MVSRNFSTFSTRNLSTRLIAFLNMQPDEARPVGLLVGLYFTLITGFVFLQSTTFGLFIAEFGAQRLPYAYLSIAVLASLVAFGYLKLSDRIEFTRLITLNLGFLSAMCLFFWIGLGTALTRWFIFLLPFWFQTQINLINLVVWPLAGRIFDLRQAKRLFGLIGTGIWLPNVLAGFVVAPVVAGIGTRNLLLITALATLAGLFVLRIVIRFSLAQPVSTTAGSSRPATASRPKPEQQRAASPYLKDPYIRLIFAYILFWWISFYFIDNIFYDRAGAQFSDAALLAGFIGQLLSATGIVALIAATIITGRVIARYGLRTGLLAMPVLVAFNIAGLAILGTFNPTSPLLFWLASLAKLLNVALGFSLSQAASTILYQPLPGHQRAQTQTVAEGIVQPLAIGLAGLMLLLLNTVLHLGVVSLAYVFFFIAAGWFIVIFRLSRRYPQVLADALAKRRLGEDLADLNDPSGMQILVNNLNHAHAGVVLYAMRKLQEWDASAWNTILVEKLPALLAHPEPEVRREVFGYAEQLKLPGTVTAVARGLERETDAGVKAAALCSLAAVGGEDELTEVARYIQDTHPGVQRGALVALLRYGGIDGILSAGQAFNMLLQSPDFRQRLQAAEILGQVSSSQFYQPVMRLLDDPHPEVRRAAVRAAGQIGNERLWPAILDACASPETQRLAEHALVDGGGVVLPLIAAMLQQLTGDASPHLEGSDHQRCLSMVDVCGRIGGQQAVDLLLRQLETPGLELRQHVLLALSHCCYQAAANDVRLTRLLRSELQLAAWLVAFLSFLEVNNQPALLKDLLMYLLRGTRDRVLLILSLLYNASALLRARATLLDPASTQRAIAMEVIDNQLLASQKDWIMPLVEDSGFTEKLQRFQSAGIQAAFEPAQAMRVLLNGEVPSPSGGETRTALLFPAWVRAGMLHLIGQQGLTDYIRDVQAVRTSPEMLVSQSAHWALARLGVDGFKGVVTMLSPVEKVLILKTADVFGQTPDEVLADVVFFLEELDVAENELIFTKGDLGDSMYIVVSGKVRVHDGERTVSELSDGNVFGEMALLDPEPRSASVTASEATRLLRLGQEPFLELIARHPEVATGIIRNLTHHLRSRVQDLNRLDARLRECEQSTA